MGGPVVAPAAPVRPHAVLDFKCTTLDDDSHAEAVGDTNAGHVGAGVGLGKRRHGVGDVLGDKHRCPSWGSGASEGRWVTCALHRGPHFPGASPRGVCAPPGTLMCQGPTYRSISAPIERPAPLTRLRPAPVATSRSKAS